MSESGHVPCVFWVSPGVCWSSPENQSHRKTLIIRAWLTRLQRQAGPGICKVSHQVGAPGRWWYGFSLKAGGQETFSVPGERLSLSVLSRPSTR